MDKLVGQSGASARDVDYDYGIRDLEVVTGPNGVAVYASSGSYGGMSGYRLNTNGALMQVDEIAYAPTRSAGLGTEMTLIDFGGGNIRMVVGGTGAGRLFNFEISDTGQIGDARLMAGVDTSIGVVGTIVQTDDGVLLANPWDTGFSVYTQTGNRLTSLDTVRNTGDSLGASVRDVVVLEQGGKEFFVSGSQGITSRGWSLEQTGLTAYEMRGGEARLRDTLGAEDGLGLMVPNDMTVVQVGNQQYAVVASAYDNAGALSIIAVNEAGSLRIVDHVGDTRDTRFGAAQAVESITHEGRAYVVAGGGDDGVSLFTLTPDGKLVLLDSFADTLQTGLDGITALELAVHNNTLHVFVASQSDAGVSHLTFDVAAQGDTRLTPAGGGQTVGSGGDDILQGRGGDDRIEGRSGDDVLGDGAGSDTLSGGSGADVFMLSADDTRDRIEDFDIRFDKIDLSQWAFFTDPDDLVLQRINGGVRITFNDEQLDVMQGGGPRIEFDDLREAIADAPTRVFEVPSLRLNGGNAADELTGDWGADFLNGGGGDDTLSGGAGDDRLDGGAGRDVVNGGSGVDTAEMHVSQRSVTQVRQLGENSVQVTTSRGVDVYTDVEQFTFSDGTLDFQSVVDLSRGLTLTGNGAADVITGGGGHDTLSGEGGRDTLNGGAGNDVLDGGRGNDQINGGAGTDRAILSVAQADVAQVIRLSSTSVEITTSEGRDVFTSVERFQFTDGTLTLAQMLAQETGRYVGGGTSADTLDGGQGGDTLAGFSGNDRLAGGPGADMVRAGQGNDYLMGGSGQDTLAGGAGNDTIVGGGGTDVAMVSASLASINVRTFSDGRIELRSADGTDVFDGIEWFELNDAFLKASQIRALSDGTVGGSGGGGGSSGGSGAPGVSRTGGEGRDRLIGTNDNDTLSGRGGNDYLDGSRGNDTLDGGTGDDVIKGGTGNDRIVGGWGEDTLAGGKGDDVIFGGPSENRLLGQAGNDTLYGGTRDDNLKGGGGADLLVGDDGEDFLKGGTRSDTVNGGKGDDRIAGNRHEDRLNGGGGRDVLNGGGESDTLDGGAGADTLKGGAGSDVFVFRDGGGRDRIVDFDHRQDTLSVEEELLSGQRGGNAVLNAYATVTNEGVVLDFGGGDVITIVGLRNISQLGDNIDIA